MAEYAEDFIGSVDFPVSGPPTFQINISAHTHRLTNSEFTSLRAAAVAGNTDLDTWWSNQGGVKASWWAGLTSAQKAKCKAAILAMNPE